MKLVRVSALIVDVAGIHHKQVVSFFVQFSNFTNHSLPAAICLGSLVTKNNKAVAIGNISLLKLLFDGWMGQRNNWMYIGFLPAVTCKSVTA